MLTHALPDLGAWTRHFLQAPVPVLPQTAATLQHWRECEDAADASTLAHVIGADPLMALRLFIHVGRLRPERFTRGTETVTEALVFLGIAPFFDAFASLPTTDTVLADLPEAREALLAVLERAQRAATFSLAFAVHRMDPDAAVLHQAALMHDYAEMLLWCHAAPLAMEIRRRQSANPGARSATVQREVLRITLDELAHALMRAWRLPEILVHACDGSRFRQIQIRNILLAVRLARHTQQHWHNAAVPDDISEIASFLNLSVAAARQKVMELHA